MKAIFIFNLFNNIFYQVLSVWSKFLFSSFIKEKKGFKKTPKKINNYEIIKKIKNFLLSYVIFMIDPIIL
jgi:hypothetical protein